ncbi:MAG: hypothetical protein EHM35_14525 [Planctomycetaceae bacterium]|nr:MAG: hypothetical protein EHM35_14525 [Planctomycetaceae bacterium]
MEESQKVLTPSQKADRLWAKLKARALDLKHGRLTVELIVDGGHIVRAEVESQRESLIAD